MSILQWEFEDKQYRLFYLTELIAIAIFAILNKSCRNYGKLTWLRDIWPACRAARAAWTLARAAEVGEVVGLLVGLCSISGVAAAAAMVGLDPLGVPPPLVVCAGEDEDVADTIISSSSSST